VNAATNIRGDAPPTDPELLDMLRELFAAAADGGASQRPSRAQTTVTIHVEQPDGTGAAPLAFLALDREPVVVEPAGAEAEVDLVLTREDLAALLCGELHLALAIARGDVSYRGPVRKFLRITPVLRGLASPEWPPPRDDEFDYDAYDADPFDYDEED
jgi:hypothetical protein